MPCSAVETTDNPMWTINGTTFLVTHLPNGLIPTTEGLFISGSVLLNYNSTWFQCAHVAYFGPPVNNYEAIKSAKGYLLVKSKVQTIHVLHMLFGGD